MRTAPAGARRQRRRRRDSRRRPTLPPPPPSRLVEGRLRVLSDPDTYVARLTAEAASQADKARRAVASADVASLAECTFAPAVHDAPEYIKRIARSMALTRAVKAPDAVREKQEWR